MTRLNLGPDLNTPVDAVTETFGIVGIKGSGKSTTAKVLVEELTAAGQQCVVLDPTGAWWGLKSSADGSKVGLPFTVLGGEHGDVAITPEAGHTIADLVIDERTPLVIDLLLMRKAEQRRFVLAFVEQLYHRNREPLMLVVDECDLFVPQRPMKGEERLLGAMEDLVRRGRKLGIGVTLISQRPASVHKDVLSQVGCLVTHRLVGPQDRAALDSWVQAHGTREQRDTMMATLAGLPTGTAWFWSPSWLDVFAQVPIRAPHTFDSSATPKAGQRQIEPKVLSAVDVDALRDRLGKIVADAEANDPKALKRQITELRRRISQLESAAPQTEVVERTVEVPIPVVHPDLAGVLESFDKQIDEVIREARSAIAALGDAAPTLPTRAARPVTPARATPTRPMREAPAPRAAVEPDSNVHLRAGARRILETVAARHPMRLTQAQVGTLAKFKTSGGTFGTYKGNLIRGGYIEVDGAGYWTATELGLDTAGVAPAAPMGTDEVIAQWRSVLRAGARAMLDVLIEHYPNAVTRDELAEATGMTATGGTFGTYLGNLRSNGLADVRGQEVTASDTLFIDVG